MILFFADRQLNIIGQASTMLPEGLTVLEDRKTEDIETGVAVFECRVPFDDVTLSTVYACTEVGNYILRNHDKENEFYTIIDAEIDTKNREVYIYAEDAGLDLLNEVVGEYAADKAYPISHYIEKFAYDSGFEIGVNEAASLTRQLSWDGETTAAERIASVATQFDGCEVSYSFDIVGLEVTHKYINIYKQRGKDIGATLRLNADIDRIVTKKSIANLATALRCTGGTPDQSTTVLEVTSSGSPQVEYRVDFETTSRTASAVQITATVTAALKSESAELGETYGLKASVYIGGAWHSAIIKATDKDHKQKWEGTTNHSTEYTFTVSGVAEGTVTFSNIQFKVERTDSVGGNAGVLGATNCGAFKIPNYIEGGENGEDINSRPITLDGYKYDDGDFHVDGAVLKSRKALQRWSRYSWTKEPNKTGAGGHIVKTFSHDTLEQSELCAHAITELKKICEMEVNYEVDIAKLPDNVKIGDRINIVDDAGELYVSARVLQLEASVAEQEHTATLGEYLIKGSGIHQKVIDLAAEFKVTAEANAKARAEAAKKAAQAKAEAEAARQAAEEAAQKAAQAEQDLTEAQAKAAEAQAAADEAEAQAKAAEAAAAQAKADAADASAACTVAQSVAQTATTKAEAAESTAETAKSEATEAKTTAAAAKLDAQKAVEDVAALGETLETVTTTMQADYARKTDLTETTASLQSQIEQNAAQIKSTVSSVTHIDETANNAKEQAEQAQSTATAAQAQADAAKADATKAQTAADNAATAAANAQTNANNAAAAAQAAQTAADEADAKAAAAESDLATAKDNLAKVTSRVGATESEVAAAKTAVQTAQAAADKAKQDAAAAQSTADTAKTNAATAQTAANNAVTAASTAQTKANEAKKAADDAQSSVNALAVRVTNAETSITQNSNAIALRATKTEVSQTLGGYYTKTEADAAIKVKADAVETSVSKTYATKDALSSVNTTLSQRADGLDVSVANSAKTATSFLSYDSANGLQVGNKTSGSWSGYRTQIKPSEFNILDASGKTLASYGANTIELGKNNENADIKLCGGIASIKADTMGDTKYAVLSSEHLLVSGNEGAALQSQQNINGILRTARLQTDVVGNTPYVSLHASNYEQGTANSTESYVYVRPDNISLESPEYIRVVAPLVNVEGDAGITGMYYDNQGLPIRNGLAAYTGGGDSGINPNITLDELILTSHTNAPQGAGTFYFIHTSFYNGKTVSAARAQFAYPYNKTGATYHRYYANGAWSAWTSSALAAYPVGSYYISGNDTSPASLFGGTWHRIESRFLWAAPSTSTLGATAGEMTHTLTASEMPSHTHGATNGTLLGLRGVDGKVERFRVASGSSYYAFGATAMDGISYGGDVASTGGGAAHNNMPPYVTVAIWRRTA